jgi:phosphoserine phosphatase
MTDRVSAPEPLPKEVQDRLDRLGFAEREVGRLTERAMNGGAWGLAETAELRARYARAELERVIRSLHPGEQRVTPEGERAAIEEAQYLEDEADDVEASRNTDRALEVMRGAAARLRALSPREAPAHD